MLPGLLHLTTTVAVACGSKGISTAILPTWYEYLNSSSVGGRCTPAFNFPADIPNIVLAIVDIILRLGTYVAVGYVIYGGFRYLLSRGEPANIKSAQETVINALIGLGIAISASGIVALIGAQLS
jgi:hypothetical protein